MTITDLEPIEPAQQLASPTTRSTALAPRNLTEAMELARLIADSDLAPKDYKGKPGNCLIAMQLGAELGLAPMQSLQNVAVINGRPCVWGDAMLALVQGSGKLEWINECEQDGVAVCTVKRSGYAEPIVRTFSRADAQKAGLLGKQGPWQQYEARMRQMRARAFALRDGFADVLRGLQSAEEVSDYAVVDTKPAPVAMPQPKPVGAGSTSTAQRPHEVTVNGRTYYTAGVTGPTLAEVWRANGRAKAWLAEHGIASAQDLTEETANRLLLDLASATETAEAGA